MTKRINIPTSQELTRLGRFLLVGAAGTLLAKSLATGVVVFWNYLANRNWTFGCEKQDSQNGEQAQAGA